ncbi:MAG: GDCCVxC domain-containing (seleno)protein [Sedimenticolaceae bacterium]
MKDPVLESTSTCPECGVTHTDEQCVWYWRCPGCGVLLQPKPGGYGVYFSFGSVPCPPVQRHSKSNCCGPSTE